MTRSPAILLTLDALVPGIHPIHVVSRLKAALQSAYDRRQNRLTYEFLLGADKHLLDDIGITRDDLRSALIENGNT